MFAASGPGVRCTHYIVQIDTNVSCAGRLRDSVPCDRYVKQQQVTILIRLKFS